MGEFLIAILRACLTSHMWRSIPIVYYGQEQRFHGGGDPGNREPLWPSQYNKTMDAYVLIQKLNMLRNHLVNTTDWATERTTLLATAATGIAIMKGNVVSMLTTIGSPSQPVALQTFVPWAASTPTMDVLTCTQYAVGAGGTINVGYSQGGRPVVLVPNADLDGSGICTAQVNESMGKVASASGGGKNAAAAGHTLRPSLAVAAAGLTAAWTWGWA
jgi:alpha-amylase